MSLPPPIPTSARSGKGVPAWTWPIIVGAPLLLIGVVFLVSQIAPEKPMEAWRPAMGVPQTQPDEQLSVGPNGTFVYRNKTTGEERTVRNEPLPADEPAWLHVPVEAKRLTAVGRRGSGRRQALFSYNMDGDLDLVFAAFERPLRKEGLSVRVDSRWQVVQLIGSDAQREVLVHVKRRAKGTEVTVHLTEPDRP